MNSLSEIQESIDKSNIEISILACPYDIMFLRHNVPHLIKSLGFVGSLRTLLVDCMPATGYYSTIYPERQEEEFDLICAEFLSAGWIDRILRIPYEPSFVTNFLGKNVVGKFRATHNIRGYPIYGSMFGVLNSEKKYLIHFDSDMLIHQGVGQNWIDTGISLLSRFLDIGAVIPRSGPPATDGMLHQGNESYFYDDRGFNSFTSFTSRVYLVDVERFRNIHPVKPLWLGRKDRLCSLWNGKGNALSWESFISHAFTEKSLVRADLASRDSWSLHPPFKDQKYLQFLPKLIELVESGIFPIEQSGYCDFNPQYWHEYL